MNPWAIFFIGSVLLTLAAGILFAFRRKQTLDISAQPATRDARILLWMVWLASLSILAYIAFAFGKR